MKKYFSIAFLALCLGAAQLPAAPAEQPAVMGIVNFADCISNSKFGKQEQAGFEALKKQMSSLLEETEKQLTEISNKFNDPEYIDGLSPEAEEEMKNKFRALNEDLNRYQNQYYQVLNQANMRVIQTMGGYINIAAENVAKDKKLQMVINKEACFFYTPKLDVTSFVIADMDKAFEVDIKNKAAQAADKTAQAAAVSAQPAEAAPAEKK